MGDDGRAIHFTAGSRDGQHHAQRNGCFGSLIVQIKCLPEITVGAGAHGDGLATVNGAAAANSQDKVHVVLFTQLNALIDLFGAGVGHDA